MQKLSVEKHFVAYLQTNYASKIVWPVLYFHLLRVWPLFHSDLLTMTFRAVAQAVSRAAATTPQITWDLW
jgi:hypothetical protein